MQPVDYTPPPQPILLPDALYRWDDVKTLLRIGQRAEALWRAQGLKLIRPRTRQIYVVGRDVIEVMIRVSQDEEKYDAS